MSPYSAPSSKATGDLISAADWNTNTITNVDYLKGRMDEGELWLTNPRPAYTSGPGTSYFETTSDKVNINTVDFDAAAIEYASWQLLLPQDYDSGTITFQVYYTNLACTDDDVIWTLQGVAFANSDSLDIAFGAAVDVTFAPASYTNYIMHITGESTAVTIAGTPAPGNLCVLRLSRKASDGGDTLNVDAKLIGLRVIYGRQ